MKIAIVIDSLRTGGAEWQALLGTLALRQGAEDASLVSYLPGNDYASFIQTRNLPVTDLSATTRSRTQRIWRLAEYLSREQFDVVHAFGLSAARYTCLAARLARSPVVFAGLRGQLVQHPLAHGLNQLVTRNTSGWIVNAHHLKEFAVNHYRLPADRVHVVPNGLDEVSLESQLSVAQAKQKFHVESSRSLITMVANFHRVKNHEMFLRVAQRLVVSGVPAEFALAGDGPRRAELEQLATSLGLHKRVRFLGHCACVADLLRASDIATLTSWNEGTPNAVLEASAMGLPVVSTDNGGAREIIRSGRTGYLVPINDDEAMARYLAALVAAPLQRATMGAEARRLTRQHFSLQALSRRLLRAYRTGIESGTSRRSAVASATCSASRHS